MRLNFRLLSSAIQKRPFYITTPIFYVNAAPHLGHLYTAVVADAIQRFEKLTNPDCQVIFSTGTDEHGTKIQQAASKANLSLPEYCTSISNEYKELFKDYNIEYTDFIRTTEDRHKRAVKHFWNKLVKKDYIYKAKYSGWYSINDESFVPESHVKDDIKNGKKVKVSVESGHRVEWTEETNYMFRLSAFKTHLKEWLQNDGVITPIKFQRQLQEYLEREVYFPDISVSRPSSRVHWAIRVPNDPDQSIYVWLDALINYLTVIGYPHEDTMIARGRPWPADVHVLGKDILKIGFTSEVDMTPNFQPYTACSLLLPMQRLSLGRILEEACPMHGCRSTLQWLIEPPAPTWFHGLYWPAFLMAIKWHPPRRLVCHSHWTVDGAKMSKSLGNVVVPKKVGVDPEALRYLLLREATMIQDANFSEAKLINTVNAELADTLGNLASRCCGTALNPRGEFPPLHAHELSALHQEEVAVNLLDRVERLPVTCHGYYTNYQFYKVVDSVIQTLHLANLFFETNKPWDLRKQPENQKQLDVILHITMETLRICGIILQPIIPELCTKLLDKLQIQQDFRLWQHSEVPSWRIKGAIYETKYIQSGKFVLFQRIYSDKKNVQKKKANA